MSRLSSAMAITSILILPACSLFNKSTPPPAPAPAPVQAPIATETRDSSLSIADIKQTQSALRERGLYHGRIDGVWGPATSAALSEFQQQKNLPATGRMNPQTADALKAPPQNRDQPAQPAQER